MAHTTRVDDHMRAWSSRADVTWEGWASKRDQSREMEEPSYLISFSGPWGSSQVHDTSDSTGAVQVQYTSCSAVFCHMPTLLVPPLPPPHQSQPLRYTSKARQSAASAAASELSEKVKPLRSCSGTATLAMSRT